MFNIRDYGAKADKTTNDAPAIQAAIDACHAAGGGTVHVPAGDYRCGMIRLRSHVTLELGAGATLWTSTDPADYELMQRTSQEGYLLQADGAEHVAIVGQGTLRGEGNWPLGRFFGVPEKPPFRVGILLFTGCRQVTIRDITILYGDAWTLHLKRCERVVIDGITIHNDIRHINSDGIDPNSCRDVRISNCHIVAGDDCIVLKATDPERYPCENVVVTNCTLETTCTAIKLGTESWGDFRDIHFSNCTIRNTSVGIGFYLKDGATMERMTFSNISIENLDLNHTKHAVFPIYMDIERRDPDSKVGAIRDISFSDIQIHGGSGTLIQGMPERPIENLALRNVTMRVETTASWDQREKAIGGRRTTSDARDTLYARKPSYFTIAHVRGLTLDGVRAIIAKDAYGYYPRSAVGVYESDGAVIRDVRRVPAGAGSTVPVLELHNCQQMMVTGCLAARGTPVFVGVSGEFSRDISLAGNDLRAAAEPVRRTVDTCDDVVCSL